MDCLNKCNDSSRTYTCLTFDKGMQLFAVIVMIEIRCILNCSKVFGICRKFSGKHSQARIPLRNGHNAVRVNSICNSVACFHKFTDIIVTKCRDFNCFWLNNLHNTLHHLFAGIVAYSQDQFWNMPWSYGCFGKILQRMVQSRKLICIINKHQVIFSFFNCRYQILIQLQVVVFYDKHSVAVFLC